jgi:hypothetical protein
MPFMAALLLALVVPIIYWAKTVAFASAASGGNGLANVPVHVQLTVLPIALLSAGFMLGVLSIGAEFRPDRDINYAPYLFLVGGALGAALFGYAAFNKGGWWIPCALASAYLCYTAIDHLVFCFDRENTGVLSTELARSTDVDCEAPYLLVRKTGNAFEYRCRKNIQLGNQFGTPFIPWPSYTSGSSEQLLAALEKLQADVAAQERERKVK